MLNELRMGATKIIMAYIPQENYPPSSIEALIAQCIAADRKDLGLEIMNNWNEFIQKYNHHRANPEAAIAHFTNSIAKHLFEQPLAGGANTLISSYTKWFEKRTKKKLSKAQKAKISDIKIPQRKGIKYPKPGESFEDWKKEAKVTADRIQEVEISMEEVSYYLTALMQQVDDTNRKISEYGPKGAKHKTKSGNKHKFVERIPKWKKELKGFEKLLKEFQGEKSKFDKSKKSYKKAKATTKEYEKAAQDSLKEMLKNLKNMKSKDQKKAFEKLRKMFDKEGKAAAGLVTAGMFDKVIDFFKGISNSIKDFFSNLMGIKKANDDFEKLANIK